MTYKTPVYMNDEIHTHFIASICGIVSVVGRVFRISDLGYVQHTSLLTASTIIITWVLRNNRKKNDFDI